MLLKYCLCIGTDRHGKAFEPDLEYAKVHMTAVLKEDETKTTVEIAIPASEDDLNEHKTMNGNLKLETKARNVDSDVEGERVEVVNLPEFLKNKGLEGIFADFQVTIIRMAKSYIHVC